MSGHLRHAQEGGGLVVGDKIKIDLEIEAVLQE
jgi:urease accessory protein UreH